MSKLLATLLALTATSAFAATTYTIEQAQAQLVKEHCVEVEVWEAAAGCARGQSDCTSMSTKDGANTILNLYKSEKVLVTIKSTGKMCSVAIFNEAVFKTETKAVKSK